MASYSVQQVVATGCTDALVAFRVPLPAPAWEVPTIQKTVLIDRAEVTLENALLRGRLRACYTVAGAPARPIHPAPPGTTQTWHAPLQAVWAETGFCLAIPIPQAQPDHDIAVTEAHVTSHVVTPQTDQEGRFHALDDQSLIHLAVRLTCTVDLHTNPAPAPPPAPPLQAPIPPRKGSAFTRFDSRTTR